MSFLYIIDNTAYQIYDLKIVSSILWEVFLSGVYRMQFLILMGSNSYFFCSLYFGVLRNQCLIQGNEDLYLFSFKSLVIIALMFNFKINFELIFLYQVMRGSTSVLLHVEIQLSSTVFKRKLFIHWIVLLLCRKSGDH